jgi:hypothetical protein
VPVVGEMRVGGEREGKLGGDQVPRTTKKINIIMAKRGRCEGSASFAVAMDERNGLRK